MTLLQAYCIPGLGNILHSFLRTDDELRLDSTCRTVREFHRSDVYPTFKHLDMEEVDYHSDTMVACRKYATKLSRYAEQITYLRNASMLKIPRLHSMPRVREIRYAIPLVVDISNRSIHHYTWQLWEGVEALLHELSLDIDHPMESIQIVPGNLLFVRTSFNTGEVVSEKWMEDAHESTHLLYYRRLHGRSVWIPNNLWVRLRMPDILASPLSGDAYEYIEFWSWQGPDTLGAMMLDFN